MKKITRALSLLLAILMLTGTFTISAAAAQPDGWWAYFQAYQSALESGNVDEILRTGDEYLEFFSKHTLTEDIAKMSFNIYRYRYENRIFEKRGDYDAAIDNVKKLYDVASYLNTAAFAEWLPVCEASIRKLDPMAEVYAVTGNTESYPYYGAMYEPESGTYFGRIERRNSNMKSENATELQNESVVSFYVALGTETAADFYWKIEDYTDGSHLVHIALNFPDEASTAKEVIAGQHDSNIMKTLNYLADLDCPVMLRIGAEMDVWTDAVTPEDFKAAYIHIAKMARTYAPNVALIFSPNYVASYYDDVENYYPGDEYVDWVGVSLYMNGYISSGSESSDIFFGRDEYCDAILNVKEIVEKFGDRKPIMVTEGGAVHTTGGVSYTEEAAEQTFKMYSVLNMVYPQIKAIVTFDTEFNGNVYTLSKNSTVQAAHDSAVASNPTLINTAGGTAKVYTKLENFCELTDTLELSAYADTLLGNNITVTYTLDGIKLSSSASLPYNCSVDAASLITGTHILQVSFEDDMGWTETKTYTLTKLTDGTVTTERFAFASTQSVLVDGVGVTFEAYALKDENGNDTNYVKLRDIAHILNNSAAQFNVGWDGAVNITTGEAYVPTGNEMKTPYSGDMPYEDAFSDTKVNGTVQDIKAILLTDAQGGGYTYYKLRDLGKYLGFNVDWSLDKGIFIETDKPYTDQD